MPVLLNSSTALLFVGQDIHSAIKTFHTLSLYQFTNTALFRLFFPLITFDSITVTICSRWTTTSPAWLNPTPRKTLDIRILILMTATAADEWQHN